MTTAETSIVGVRYREGGTVRAAQLTSDEQFDLTREPTNSFDPNAVRVYTREDGFFLGYIPKPIAPFISAMLEHNIPLECTLISNEPATSPQIRIAFNLGETKCQ